MPRNRGKRRPVDWYIIDFNEEVTTDATSTMTLIDAPTLAELEGIPTVSRIIADIYFGGISVTQSQSTPTVDAYAGLGIRVTNEDAVAANPLTGLESWLWEGRLYVNLPVARQYGVGDPGNNTVINMATVSQASGRGLMVRHIDTSVARTCRLNEELRLESRIELGYNASAPAAARIWGFIKILMKGN